MQMRNQEAYALTQQSLQLFRELHQQRGVARALSLLAFIAGYNQEHARALALAEESLLIFRETGEQWGVATQLQAVAELALRQNNFELGLAYAEESLHLSQRVGNREATARALCLLARVEWRRQGNAEARPLLVQSLTLYEELGHQEGMALVLLFLSHAALYRKDLREARTLLERSFQILVQKENKPALIENLAALAQLAAAEGQVDWAIRLLGAHDSLRQAIGRPPLSLADAYRRISALAITPPGEQTFADVWAEGRAMSPQQVFSVYEQTAITIRAEQEQREVSATQIHLTTREREVLRLLSGGLTNKQIAQRLVISSVTANSHVRAIYNKLEVNSRSAATRYALLHQLV
jgi:ATP/maltotriose-dependent transcriptional regulator MalT